MYTGRRRRGPSVRTVVLIAVIVVLVAVGVFLTLKFVVWPGTAVPAASDQPQLPNTEELLKEADLLAARVRRSNPTARPTPNGRSLSKRLRAMRRQRRRL